jgi:hypothetical protein
MGLGLGDFLDLTPFEWLGVKKRFIEARNTAFKERWELARWTVFRTTCPPQPKMKGGLISMTDFRLFPWEEEVKSGKKEKDEARFLQMVEKFKD